MTGVTSAQLWFSRLEEERLDVKNYKWRLNSIWHRMLFVVPVWQQWTSKG